MNNPVRTCVHDIACCAAVLLSGIAQQAHAAAVQLEPPAPSAYSPGLAAVGAMMPDDFALLLWAPVLLFTLLCGGGLLFLVWRQGDSAARRSAAVEVRRPKRRRGRLGTVGSPESGIFLR